jgi:hypothetical protein
VRLQFFNFSPQFTFFDAAGLLGMFTRNATHTHRPFTMRIMDPQVFIFFIALMRVSQRENRATS